MTARQPTAAAGARGRDARPARVWLPKQHGAWAMLAVPLLVGVAAGGPTPAGASPWQAVLAGAAVAAYLASATAQAWARGRRRTSPLPTLVYATVLATLGLPLVATHPGLLLALVVLVPAGAIVAAGAKPGTPRDLANTLAQVAQAVVLVPAAAALGPAPDMTTVALATGIAAAFLLGTVLVVRSVLRGRGDLRFAALSVGYHVVLAVLAALLLPVAFALLAVALVTRAAALPILQRRWAGGSHPLRPVHVGMVELAAGVALVAVAFAAL